MRKRNLEKDYAMGDLEDRLTANQKVTGVVRVTEADVLANIKAEYSFTLGAALDALGVPVVDDVRCMTVCVLVMKNGFSVQGVSACADPKGFNAEVGREIAKRNAVSVAWGHMGYELRSKLHEYETKAEEARKLGVMAKTAEDDMSCVEQPNGIGSMDE
jgi:hypothetical protein